MAGAQQNASKATDVIRWADQQHEFLLATLEQLLGEPGPKALSRVLYQAHQIQRACAASPSGVLAALQLNRNPRFNQIKELFVALLCEQVGAAAGLTSSARLSLVCAALTHDLGMLELQHALLDKQSTPLTAAQKKLIHRHPAAGAGVLQRAGVKDRRWLAAVAQHHERLDGNGYPTGLSGDAILTEARLLHICDSYVAMSRPRGDRPALLPKQVIKQLFELRGRALDATLCRSLIDTLGMYPPGSGVRLANGEQGLVVGAGRGPAFPLIAAIISSDGEHLEAPLLRDGGERHYTVVEMVPVPFHFNLSRMLVSLWQRV